MPTAGFGLTTHRGPKKQVLTLTRPKKSLPMPRVRHFRVGSARRSEATGRVPFAESAERHFPDLRQDLAPEMDANDTPHPLPTRGRGLDREPKREPGYEPTVYCAACCERELGDPDARRDRLSRRTGRTAAPSSSAVCQHQNPNRLGGREGETAQRFWVALGHASPHEKRAEPHIDQPKGGSP
jgi:hypothetical protein